MHLSRIYCYYEKRGFFSEHTAEYVLVPNLIAKLRSRFYRILPIYFWSSREGSAIALESMKFRPVKILTVFARRPKIENSQSDKLEIKINRELIDYTDASIEYGISVLAGFPLATSLLDLTLDAQCCYIDLHQFAGAVKRDCFFTLCLTSDTNSAVRDDGTKSLFLSDAQLTRVADRCTTQSWGTAVNTLRVLRAEQSGFRFRFPFMGGYKPFHLILVESDD